MISAPVTQMDATRTDCWRPQQQRPRRRPSLAAVVAERHFAAAAAVVPVARTYYLPTSHCLSYWGDSSLSTLSLRRQMTWTAWRVAAAEMLCRPVEACCYLLAYLRARRRRHRSSCCCHRFPRRRGRARASGGARDCPRRPRRPNRTLVKRVRLMMAMKRKVKTTSTCTTTSGGVGGHCCVGRQRRCHRHR